MKKFLSIVLSILMVVTMLLMAVMPASAATPTPYDGVPVTPQKISSSNYAKLGLTSSNWSQFNGYYAIRNAKELYGFAAVSRSSYTANAVLLQDIVVNANGGTTYDWTPIISSNAGYIYDSIFDGNGHYISGLYSTVAITAIGGNNSKFGGFICRLGGTAKNLVIKNSTFAPWEDISTYGGLGAITGCLASCTIQNCRVENITLKSINDGGRLGGIAGAGNGDGTTIKNCVSINVTFSGGKYTDPIASKAPYSNCYTSATASHNCTNLSVEHKEVKATCEYPGLSNYKYCLVCGKVTSGTKTETPATGHTLKSATCIAPKTCTICGATEGSIDNTAHSWANNDGICANGCGATCAHKNQTGSACEICGAELHVCSNYNNGFCTECDAYEPAELKDGYYQIKNGGNLFWYANYINTVDTTANAVLTADIDLENRPWTPIGSTGENSNNFRGIFDGQNYIIRGLYVEGGRAGLGFFGEVRTGTVKNFTIFGEVVVNTEVDYVGGVIGSVCGLNSTDHGLERNGAIIQNIKSFVNLTAKAHGIGKIGGFVGYANHQSLIENCSWYGTFDAGIYRVDSGAGGFIGKIQENSSEVTIRNCGAYGTIKTNYAGDYNNTATIYMGGFLSFTNTNAQTTLENCLFAGKFERGENLTDQAFLGAFGTVRSVKAIKNCYYLGDDGLEAVHSDSNLKPGSDNVEITNVTAEQLKSGDIAYKLQEANEIWGQSIGTDSFPVLGGEDVYCGYTACDDEAMVYTNDSTVSATKPDHSWGEGSLTRPTKTQDGYYTYTCSACGETKTEEVERAANYDEYEKALNDLRAYLDSDMLTDENKSYISEWLATYDTDEAFCFIAGEEATLQEYIDATAYYASEFKAAIENCLAGNHSGNGDYCEICGEYIHTCDFTGEWEYDTGKHWKECTCGLISEEAGHDWSALDGKCACGYECSHENADNDEVCDICGKNADVVIDGVNYICKGDITNTGIIIHYDIIEDGCYKAGDGYVILKDMGTDPDSNEMILYNATIDVRGTENENALKISQEIVEVTFIGTNYLYSDGYSFYLPAGYNNYPTTFVGDDEAVLNLYGNVMADSMIVESGTVNIYGIGDEDKFVAVRLEDELVVREGAVVNIINGESEMGLNCSIAEDGITAEGTLNAIMLTGNETEEAFLYDMISYGDAVLGADTFNPYNGSEEPFVVTFNIPEGTSVTVPEGITLNLDSFDGVTIDGELIVNGTLICTHTGGEANCAEKAVCEICKQSYGDIDADNHDIIIDEAVSPDCVNTGLTAGQHCSRCDAMTIIQEVIPAINHKDTLVQVEAKAPTCTEAGYEAYEYCTACDYTTYKEIPASHSIVTVEKKDATCTEAGYEAYEYCTACDYTTYKEIPVAGHTEETVKGYAATCTKAGLTDGVKCSVCDAVITAQQTIDQLAHKDEDGDFLCDYGCGHEYEKPAEPDTPDTPDEPTDEACDHLCHKDGILGFLWKIIRFFYRLFNIQQYCDCGDLHYEKALIG